LRECVVAEAWNLCQELVAIRIVVRHLALRIKTIVYVPKRAGTIWK
jgi:hypothetical protein